MWGEDISQSRFICQIWAHWSLQSEKTLLMSTAKCLGAQIFRFTQVKLMIIPLPSPSLPIWNCQSSEWTLHFSMWSMRAHTKQSTNRKISGNVSVTPGKSYDIPPSPPLPPHSKLPELRVNSSIFNAVIESPFKTVN